MAASGEVLPLAAGRPGRGGEPASGDSVLLRGKVITRLRRAWCADGGAHIDP